MNHTLSRLVPPVVVLVLATFGCASPPEAEKKAGEEALSAARAAGAERYASGDLAAATSALTEAEGQIAAKQYDKAKSAYIKVKELADRAAKAVEAGKASMKAEVEQQLADAERRWQGLEGKVKTAGKKLKTEQKQAWDADAKAAGEALETAKAAVGSDPAVAKEKLAAVSATLDKWEGELKAVPGTGRAGKK